VDPAWRELIARVAEACHTSAFRTLRSALPAGWLGQRPRSGGAPRPLWLIESLQEPPAAAAGSGDPIDAAAAAGSGACAEDSAQAAVQADGAALRLGVRQQALLEHLAAHGGRRLLRELVAEAGFSRATIASLEQRGLIRRRPLLAMPGPRRGVTLPAGTPLEAPRAASEAQRQAIEAIAAAAPGSALLLWGVTGAGKTEVYLCSTAAGPASGMRWSSTTAAWGRGSARPPGGPVSTPALPACRCSLWAPARRCFCPWGVWG